MITKELLDYMRAQKASGAPDVAVDQALKMQGWADADISQARTALVPAAAAPIQAPVQAMPMGAMNQFNQPAPKSHKGLWIGLVIIILVLAGSGTAYAYFTGRLTSLSAVMAESLYTAKEAKGSSFNTTVTYEAPSGTDATGALSQAGVLGLPFDLSKVTLAIKGADDLSTPGEPKVDGTITATAGSEGASAELRVTNKTIYGQVTELPSFATALGMGDQLNKWYSFDYGSDASALNSVPFTSQLMSGTSALDDLTAAQKAHLSSITQSAHLITITGHMLPEKMDGVLTYHFTFDLDRAGIVQYATDANNYLQTAGVSQADLSGLDPSDISTLLDMTKNFSGEAWIGMSDHLPRKLDLSFDWGTGSDTTKLSKIGIVSILSNWNAPVTITVPTDSTSISELLQESQLKADDAKTQAVISSMRASAELYSTDTDNESYKGFCASSDESDAADGLTTISCHDSASYYVAYAPLADGTFSCSDSSGKSVISSAVSPTGSTCKNIVTSAAAPAAPAATSGE